MRRALVLLGLWAAALASCSDEPPPRPPLTRAEVPKSDADVEMERVKADPTNAEAWFHLGEIYERAGLYDREAEALGKVVALRPDMGWAHLKLGTTCNRLGRYEEAVRHFTDAEKRLGAQPTVYNNLAWSWAKLGKTDKQIAALRKAVALRPGYVAAHFNLGVALLRTGDPAGARKEHATLLDLDEGAAASLQAAIDGAERAAR